MRHGQSYQILPELRWRRDQQPDLWLVLPLQEARARLVEEN